MATSILALNYWATVRTTNLLKMSPTTTNRDAPWLNAAESPFVSNRGRSCQKVLALRGEPHQDELLIKCELGVQEGVQEGEGVQLIAIRNVARNWLWPTVQFRPI